jgi:flagellar biosynthetic protein FliR
VTLELSVAWAVGLSLAVGRAAALVATCSFVPRSIPAQGRNALALALGLLVSQPVATADWSSADLVTAAVVNLILGGILGWFLGLLLGLFQVAGTVVDIATGLTLGSVFDPDTGTSPGAFARLFSLAGQTLVMALGGLLLLAQVLWTSTQVIALDGRLSSLDALGPFAVERVSDLFRRGVEVSLPIAALLFIGELSFGLLSRLAPQLNTFLVMLPAKSLLVLLVLGSTVVTFPRVADGVIAGGVDAVSRLLGG